LIRRHSASWAANSLILFKKQITICLTLLHRIPKIVLVYPACEFEAGTVASEKPRFERKKGHGGF
jgi:hypothetical protein